MRNEATPDSVPSSIQSSACNPSSHPPVIIIINLNPKDGGSWELGSGFLCYFTMGGEGGSKAHGSGGFQK